MNFATTGNSVAEIWLETCDKNRTPHAVRCSSKPFNGPGYKTLCKFVWILDVFSNVYFAHNLCICLHLYTLVGGFKPIEDGTSQIGSSP